MHLSAPFPDFRRYCLVLLFFSLGHPLMSQMITGVWKGRVNRQKTELKIIQKGDSLTGTSYYYTSSSHYRRYSIKGYFDALTNEVVWWDDQLIEERPGKLSQLPGLPQLSKADFNCPGNGRMTLNGRSSHVKNDRSSTGTVELDKTSRGIFSDEWDFVIENFTAGANDPDIIDSIGAIALQQPAVPDPPSPATLPVARKRMPAFQPPAPPLPSTAVKKIKEPLPAPAAPASIEEKFISRKNILTTEIPVSGDSIELRFYDNAEIDGDSIALFLNNRLIFEHIRLLATPYIVRLAVSDLGDSSELIMVAENLGTIPPNTSFMVALVGEKRYEARLESTEGSSAMIRFVKEKETNPPAGK